MAFHGFVRATHDLDLWIKDDTENMAKLKLTLKDNCVEGLDQVRSFDLVPGFTQFQIGDSGFVVDPMKDLKTFGRLDFDKCYARAQDGEYKGIKFKVLSPADMLQEKEATNRPKDVADIEYLRALKK